MLTSHPLVIVPGATAAGDGTGKGMRKSELMRQRSLSGDPSPSHSRKSPSMETNIMQRSCSDSDLADAERLQSQGEVPGRQALSVKILLRKYCKFGKDCVSLIFFF